MCEEYRSIWHGGPSYVDTWAPFRHGIIDSLRSETHRATNLRMDSVTVGTVIAAGDEDNAQLVLES